VHSVAHVQQRIALRQCCADYAYQTRVVFDDSLAGSAKLRSCHRCDRDVRRPVDQHPLVYDLAHDRAKPEQSKRFPIATHLELPLFQNSPSLVEVTSPLSYSVSALPVQETHPWVRTYQRHHFLAYSPDLAAHSIFLIQKRVSRHTNTNSILHRSAPRFLHQSLESQ
jgi:hypothetical protein